MTGVLIRRENKTQRDRDIRRERGHHVMTEAEIEMMHLQAKACQGLPAVTRS